MTALLVWLSLIYTALPVAIFLLGWLKPVWAFLTTACLVGAIILAGRQIISALCAFRTEPTASGPASPPHGVATPRWQTLIAAWTAIFLVVAVVLLWGAGGYGPQDSDHPKHNAIFKALIEGPWPTYVASDRGEFPLVFYIAYYLPSALIGKFWGWEAACHALQLWSVAGLVLSLSWFWLLAGRINWKVPAVFFFFSGWDVVGAAIVRLWHWLENASGSLTTFSLVDIDWAALRWWNWQMRWWDLELARNYPNPIEQLFFVPHQVLGGWIIVGMIVAIGLRAPQIAFATLGILCTIVSLWAPLILIGLLPIVLWLLWQTKAHAQAGRILWRVLLSPANLLTAPAFVMIALYYATRWGPVPFSAAAEAGFGIGQPSFPWPLFLIRIGLFLLVEVFIFAAILIWLRPFEGLAECRLFWVSLIWLVILPFFRYGACNDLVMRASTPALFLFAAWVARTVSTTSTPVVKRLIVAGCLLIGSTAPFSDFYAHFREALRRGQLIQIPAKEKVLSLWELNVWSARQAETTTHPLVRLFRDQTFFLQYVGSSEGLFFRYFSRQCKKKTNPQKMSWANHLTPMVDLTRISWSVDDYLRELLSKLDGRAWNRA